MVQWAWNSLPSKILNFWPVCVSYPVWEVADSLIRHKLQNTTMCHSVRVFVCQLEQHGIGDVKPACMGQQMRTILRTFLNKCDTSIVKRNVWKTDLLSWSRADGGIITGGRSLKVWFVHNLLEIVHVVKCVMYKVLLLPPFSTSDLSLGPASIDTE